MCFYWVYAKHYDTKFWRQHSAWHINKYVLLFWHPAFKEPCIVIYSYNKSQQDAQFLKFIWQNTLHISDRLTVHHKEYLNTVYMQ
jgi:hypothetical protein